MLARYTAAIWFLFSASCSVDRSDQVDTPSVAATTSATSPVPSVSASGDTTTTAGALASTASAPPIPVASGMANPLLAAIKDTLQARNAAIGAVGILEQRSLIYISPSIVIGYGVRADHSFQGSFQDELFGFFVANDSLTRILRTLEVIPSRRWRDYSFRIARLTADSVTIEGTGDTYGNDRLVRAYSWSAK